MKLNSQQIQYRRKKLKRNQFKKMIKKETQINWVSLPNLMTQII
jgi:hypothetical protein